MELRRRLLICAVAALLIGNAGASADAECHDPTWGCPADGRTWRDSLLAALEAADEVELTEHSDPNDLVAIRKGGRLASEHVYGRVVLDARQRAYFREALKKTDVTTQTWMSACIPFFHHTIRFRRAGETIGQLDICFQCGQVEWSGTKVIPPGAIYETLSDVVSHAGLSPKREWQRLAYDAETKKEGR